MNTPIIKPGDDIVWSGQITRTGVTNFTGYVLTSQIRQIDKHTGVLSSVASDATVSWVNALAGTFTYTVSRSVTAQWPAGECFQLDIRVADPNGKFVRTESAEFKTEAGVTA